jgi:hypothetical protein
MDPPQVPQQRKRHPFSGPSSTHPLITHLSFKVTSKVAPSMFTQHGPYGEKCSVSRANGLYIPIYLSVSPVKEPFHKIAKKHKVTIHRIPHRWKAYIQWGAAWSPKGIVNDTATTTPVSCSLQHSTFHLGFGRPVPR